MPAKNDVKSSLPTPDINPIDGDKLIKETKPVIKQEKCCNKQIDKMELKIELLFEGLTEMKRKLAQIADRMGL